ncbi:MAG: hypothetical protein HY268_29880, partial [Deltaproteobacteria bacterium]|nr:hypothetical protein [Deltaproteobacteria bacterium]
WWRDPVGQNVPWEHIGDAHNVVAMTGGEHLRANLGAKLFAVTRENTLWWRELIGREVTWQRIGDAPNVVALAATAGKLFAATRDNLLLWRDAIPSSKMRAPFRR